MTWTVTSKPSRLEPRFFSSVSSSLEGEKWLLQLAPKVKTACDVFEDLMRKYGFKVKRGNVEEWDMCVFDVYHPDAEKVARKILEMIGNRLPPEKKRDFENKLEGYIQWATRSSTAITEVNGEITSKGEVATPLFHHPDLKKWHGTSMRFFGMNTCRIDEIHVHDTYGEVSLHIHFTCRSKHPSHVALRTAELIREPSFEGKELSEASIQLVEKE